MDNEDPTGHEQIVDEYRDALADVTLALGAAISLLESIPESKNSAASNKMFNRMILDYKNAHARGLQQYRKKY